MNSTVNIVCYKSKTLSNGEHPLMVCIYKEGKRKYKSLGISILPQHWDSIKNKPKKNCPNKESIQKVISNTIEKYSSQILEFRANDKEFTISNIIDKINVNTARKTVELLLNDEIERLRQEGRLKYASTYKELKTSLYSFTAHLNIYFSEIDIDWLKRYEAYLRKNGLGDNSVGIRFRTLRALYNMAIRDNHVKAEYYPFRLYKVSKLHKETVKRAIKKSDVEKIISYKTERFYTQLAVDLFYFSYLSGGINFVDMAHLTVNNIIDERLVYTRKKTKKLIKIPLQPKAISIIDKYKNVDSTHIFPILSTFHETDIQQANRINKVLHIINKSLREIGEELNLPINLTTYVARHTFATVLKRSGVNTSIISESLGHSSEKITQIYLDSFENSQIDEAMKNLL